MSDAKKQIENMLKGGNFTSAKPVKLPQPKVPGTKDKMPGLPKGMKPKIPPVKMPEFKRKKKAKKK